LFLFCFASDREFDEHQHAFTMDLIDLKDALRKKRYIFFSLLHNLWFDFIVIITVYYVQHKKTEKQDTNRGQICFVIQGFI
jgi:hypothetical protein